jgi:spore coat polysaccharide biosynthesis protein SpsF
MLVHVLERLGLASCLDDIVVATTTNEGDLPIVELARSRGLGFHTGSEDDVLDRYMGAARQSNADQVVRITADCPLIDPVTVDETVHAFAGSDLDYLSATSLSGFPRGLDTEVFTLEALARAHAEATAREFREHVTLYMYRTPGSFRVGRHPAPPELDHPGYRLCVDEDDDFRLLEEIHRRLEGPILDVREVVALLSRDPDLVAINAHVGQVIP